jgi:hypothetical protein
MSPDTAPAAVRSGLLRRRGFMLEYVSMAWMTAEAVVAITAGVARAALSRRQLRHGGLHVLAVRHPR